MLESVKITRRQSEIRQELAGLVGKDAPTDDETRAMESLDAEYRANETRYRAALISEDTERREAGAEMETRGGREWSDLVSAYEVRQAVLALDHDRPLSGQTAEVVSELRESGAYRGVPLPMSALERRDVLSYPNTTGGMVMDPTRTAPIIDRIFPDSATARMGGQLITIESGSMEIPVTANGIKAGWINEIPDPLAGHSTGAFSTEQRLLKPTKTLGAALKVSRQAMKQAGPQLEDAIRRDLRGAISATMDQGVFSGLGSAGSPNEPIGLVESAAAYGITVEAFNPWFPDENPPFNFYKGIIYHAVSFLAGSAANGTQDIRLMMRPEQWANFAGPLIAGTATSEFEIVRRNFGQITLTGNALSDAQATTSDVIVMTTTTGGVPPFFVGAWGAIDMIRDPYSEAGSGHLKLTALATMNVAVSRPEQIKVVNGVPGTMPVPAT